jgi:hypothetical protein
MVEGAIMALGLDHPAARLQPRRGRG